ncbi:bifunctional nicotinamidase/pyrazinamidase [Hymenobacter sp. 15J16-1T3B]|uniref:bifunctional nicotinamidase/pyrazinamidase n=1 Tax=Hymenobacter sp. 15J16-1T3B TaxID=2886941 RepID=UPI001D0FD58D|nr:bifunctional nicotinamidase/pyrazinamidase [Hymenobacter sp. 15J16-1T3B]MCC3159622.1 bifunctional nicotinamidase/pyrazinamidase [Hymenobacter sp. 15J16-1T3B]
MKALLLIDIQNDFVPGGALAVPGGADIIPLVNRLQPHFDLVVATQDWHPAGHLSFASSHPGKQPFDRIELYGLAQVLWPDHCVQGTAGAELHPALDQHRIEAIFRKGMAREIDSYSGFFDNGHRRSTGLADYLRGRGVTEVYLAGLAADYCVFFSAKDARGQGFSTFLIEDATRAISPDGFEQAKVELHELGGRVIQSQHVLG